MMFQALLKRMHVSPAAMIASLALVFAMSGGAFAAGRYLITSTKQISPKVLKSLTGKSGAPGATGPTGAAGPAGAMGPTGSQGLPGAPGPEGKEGHEGKAGKNGTNGTTGFTKTLPSGETETGAWAGNALAKEALEAVAWNALSFPIPLSEPLDPSGAPNGAAKYVGPGEGEGEPQEDKNLIPSACKGTVENPGATPGHLCIFAKEAENVRGVEILDVGRKVEGSGGEVGTTGVAYFLSSKEAGTVDANGTWAVTAE